MATDGPIDQDSVAWRTLMQAALESMDEGFSVFDLNLRLLAWNKRFFEQYGIPDSSYGRPCQRLLHRTFL